MQSEYLIAFAVIYSIDSLSPGPAVATVVARSATHGATRTLPLIAGFVIGDLALFALAIAGLVALAAKLGPVFVVFKWAGIAYLLWLALRLWRADSSIASEPIHAGEGWRSFGAGCLLPLGNPKAVGFYVALLPTVIDMSDLSIALALRFAVVIVLVWGGTLVLYAILAQRAGRLLSTEPARRWLNRAAAGTYVGAAGTLAVRD